MTDLKKGDRIKARSGAEMKFPDRLNLIGEVVEVSDLPGYGPAIRVHWQDRDQSEPAFNSASLFDSANGSLSYDELRQMTREAMALAAQTAVLIGSTPTDDTLIDKNAHKLVSTARIAGLHINYDTLKADSGGMAYPEFARVFRERLLAASTLTGLSATYRAETAMRATDALSNLLGIGNPYTSLPG